MVGNMCAQVMKNVLQASVTVTMHKNNRPKASNEGYYMIVDPNDNEDMALMKERSFDVLIDATSNGVDEEFWHKYVRFGKRSFTLIFHLRRSL
jgi:D-arabinose 1-dehydrogenase-like Zn-dependent alcohol dehydrogenase